MEVVLHNIIKGLEALHHEMLFIVLSSHGKDIKDDFPSWTDKFAFLVAKRSNTHDDILLNFFFALIHKIIHHDGLKWLEEDLLVAEVSELFFF